MIPVQTKPNAPPPTANMALSSSRGAFIVLEGVDRCGKTTQSGLLLKHLLSLGLSAMAMRFPDRTTTVGTLINNYLKSSTELEDRAIHLLFSANRWEAVPRITQTLLQERSTIICDRYAHSGVAFSSAKLPSKSNGSTVVPVPLTMEWCKGPDKGLPAPDAVIFLALSQEESEKRGSFGSERYEQSEMQERVRERFLELKEEDELKGSVPWHVIDASQSVEDVSKDVFTVVEQIIQKVHVEQTPLKRMWTDGFFEAVEMSENNSSSVEEKDEGGT